MRNILIALALVAPMSVNAAPHAAFALASAERTALNATAAPQTEPVVFADADETAPLFLHMPVITSRPTGGRRGALSGTTGGEISTDLLNVFLDEEMEAKVEDAPQPFKLMKLPPLAGAWLGGLSRGPVLLPEPFSWSILSIGLLGFIISRGFRRPA